MPCMNNALFGQESAAFGRSGILYLPGNYADADTSLHSIVYDCNRMKKLNFVRLKNGRKAVCVTAT